MLKFAISFIIYANYQINMNTRKNHTAFITGAAVTMLLSLFTTTVWVHSHATEKTVQNSPEINQPNSRTTQPDDGDIEDDSTIDISSAIIYNPERFINGSGEDFYPVYREEVFVYAYNNGWRKLQLETDYTMRMLDSNGEETFEVADKGCYTLVVEGIGNYSGEVSQTCYIVERGYWSSHKAESFSQIDETNKIITIMNEEEMALMAWHFNRIYYGYATYSGWTFRLGRDLDLSKYSWVPVGSTNPGEESGFLGHFDGQGHTIKGVHFDRMSSSSQHEQFYPQGLFAFVADYSSITNLTLTESEIVSGNNRGVGAIAGYLNYNTTVKNCHVTSSVNVICLEGEEDEFGGDAYGGIAGYSSAKMSGCTSAAHVFKTHDIAGCEAFGGVVGRCYLSNSGELTDCIYYGDQVFADQQTGALIGSLSNNGGTVARCIYTSNNMKGCNGTDPSGIIKMEAFDMNSILDVNYCGDLAIQYDYDGIKVYPSAMVYKGVCYTLPEYVITMEGSGTEEIPYLIKTTDDLSKVASCVNRGNKFTGKHFRLCNNLTYNGTAGNYTALGYWDGSNGTCFDGVFDGDDHSISGIHIHKSGNTQTDSYQGVFGWTGSNAVVKNLIVCNSTFTAFTATGGISGYNEGKIENCHVLGGVSINALTGNTYYHGGITGSNSSTGVVTRCSSTVSMAETGDGACGYLGGIVGYNEGNINHCLALGCEIHGTTFEGAIIGGNASENISDNYYSACTWNNAQGTFVRTSDIGCGGRGEVSSDLSTDNGAVSALRDASDNSASIALLAARADYLDHNGFTAFSATDISISGRTLHKDGSWNTLCLPFDVNSFTGSSLEGAKVNTLESSDFDAFTGTLTLNFKEVSVLEAGTPYIVKWENGDNTEDTTPMFRGVTVSGASPGEHTIASDGVVTFTGLYAPLSIGPDGDNTKLFMGSNNTLFYPNGEMSINAFRSYFQLADDIIAGEPAGNNVKSFLLRFEDGEQATSITQITTDGTLSVSARDEWYDISGRRVNGKPSAPGIYINKGRKLLVK